MTRRPSRYGLGRKRTRIPEGVEYVPLSEIKVGPRVRESLTAEQLTRAKNIWERLAPLHESGTFEKWAEGFLHDRHPDRELDVWAKIADRFHEELAKQHYDDHKKLLGDLLMESFG